jgi:hypothetical protein
VGDRAGEGYAGNILGLALEASGDLPAAALALVGALAAFQRVECDLGLGRDDWWVSLFEQQQKTYMLLQRVLLGLGQPGWALGVAAQAKTRALAYHLAAGSGEHRGEYDASSGIAPNSSYEDVCEAWWREVQADARAEGDAGAARIVEYSFLFGDKLAIWVLSGSGELLGSTTVASVAYRRDAVGRIVVDDGHVRMQSDFGACRVGKARLLLEEARATMKVRGRDAMMREGEGRDPGNAVAEDACVEQVREQAGLAVLYQHLLAPVAAHLEGAAEVLIVPHKELSEVPWAALFDSQAGQHLIERHVLRVAPSLRVVRVAREAAAGAERHAQTPVCVSDCF